MRYTLKRDLIKICAWDQANTASCGVAKTQSCLLTHKKSYEQLLPFDNADVEESANLEVLDMRMQNVVCSTEYMFKAVVGG